MKAGLFMWLVGGTISFYFAEAGMFSRHLWAYSAGFALVSMLASAWVGGMLYKEDA